MIAGGFGVGKTTLVGAVSETPMLGTEAQMTEASIGVDELGPKSAKTTTTVAMDWGRLSLDPGLLLYLFGAPGQDRFWFLWDDLVRGAVGAIVLADTRNLESSFPAINYFEQRGDIPFTVAVNRFDGQLTHPLNQVRDALDLDPAIPLSDCDARQRGDVLAVLRDLISHALSAELAH
ncbi:MAG TPA: ATP/GTP-binding protein [Actinospica sp.]|nr:ATP/GTP-binding protein [Actinospica sp.]